jgi:pyridoxamine 5'-phosphate oxidase
VDARDPRSRPLRKSDVDADPLRQFERWLRDADEAGIRAPEAVALATASAAGVPSVRMVLLKGADARGFVFYSGYESRKGRELAENPRAALLFSWDALGRQARIEGAVERLGEAESDANFAARARGAQLSAWAAVQSQPVADRAALERAVARAAARFGDGPVARPPTWGGYRLRPERYEFWQHRENRLHDRLGYEPADGAWRIVRLAP